METSSFRTRIQHLALAFAALVMLVGVVPLPLAAAQAPPIPQSGAGSQATTASSLQAMQEAYELLLDRYALPLEPAVLTGAAEEGMLAALKEKGIENPVAGLTTPGNDRAQLW